MKEIYNLDGIKSYSVISNRGLNFTTDKYSKEYLEIYPNVGNETYTDEDGTEHTITNYISVYSINTEEFTRYVKSLGLKYEEVKDKGILINNVYEMKKVNDKYIQVEIPMYNFKVGDIIKGYIDNERDGKKDCSIEIAKITTEVPMGMSKYQSGNACIFIDEKLEENMMGDSYSKYVYIDSKNANKTQEEIEKILGNADYRLMNIDEDIKIMDSFYTLVAIFLYGFITVIALIGVTNIFNTITTNMNLRRREFAMLKSIGMTKQEFNRMIRLESFFYGMKSLIIGIPIGCVLSYLIYKALVSGRLIIKYQLPISAIIISAIAVFLLITTIMKYSINKINKQNIIETIRNDNI